jgi:16S rRNA (guanine527-N7)-methyltransferase
MALSGVERDAIDAHIRLLLAWNAAINLTAIREPGAVATAHVIDSLTAQPILREREIPSFIDLGSGGGFPGLPLAIVMPGVHAVLADSVGKKVRFLDVVVEAVGLDGRVETYPWRVEELAANPYQRERWPAVTARAVASLADLVELAFPLLEPGGILIAWKRGDIESELSAAGRALAPLGGGTLETRTVTVPSLPGHCLVVVGKEGRTPDRFPRDPAQRRRSPW